MIRQIAKRFISLLLVFILVLSLFPDIIPEAAAAELTVSGTLSDVPGDDMGELVSVSAETSEENGTGSVSITKNVIKLSAKGVSKTSSGCSETPAKASTTTWTIKNTHGTAATVTYTFTKTSGDGSVSPTGGTATIQAGGTFDFKVTSAAPDTAAATSATLTLTGVTFAVAPCTTTFLAAANGTYSGSCSDGWQVTPGESHTASSDKYYQLTAVPASGYSFSAWVDGNGTILSRSNPYMMSAADRSVTVKFIPTGAAIYCLKGNEATEYYYLDQAIAAAGSSGTVVVKENGKVLGSSGQTSFSVPRGVTLLVPYDAAATVITNDMEDHVNGAYSNPPAITLYRRLTLPAGYQLSVESGGVLCVCSQALNYSKGQVGPYGQLVLEQDSDITIKNGGYLYAYGYLSESADSGTGTVTVQSGGTVYEDLMIMDYPGSASTANTLYNTEKIFPMRAYSLRNVEVPMTIHAGGTEYAFASIYGTNAGLHTVNVKIIGNSNKEAFQISSGTLTKSYSNGKHRLTMNGNCALNDMSVSLGTTIQTSSTSGLPLPSGFCIEAASGTVTINANVLLLEGTELIVDPGVTVNIASGKAVYVFDETDDAGAVNVKDYHGTAYTLVKSDCKIDVNGIVDVKGTLYTTTNKANITSSEGSGQIRYSASAGTAASVKYKSGGSAASTANLTAAQLHNGANRPSGEAEYTATAGAASGDLFGYSGTLDMWIKNPITLTFNANGGEGSMPPQMIPKGTDSVLAANTFTREGYIFLGWSTDANDETAVYSDGASVSFSADTTLYAIWENHRSYTITWKNGDGSVLKTDSLTYGQTPEYSGEAPTKAYDETNHYTFSGWTPAPAPVTEDTVYTPEFTATPHSFTEEITTPAACTTNGEKTLRCSCGYAYTEVIPMTGHDLVHHEAKEPTCTEPGWEAYDTCSRCDYTTYKELPALGHDWDEGVITTEPTLTQEGVKTFTCKRCGETRTETVDKLPAVDTAALEAAIAAAEAVARNDYTEDSLAAMDEALAAAEAALADDKLTQAQADAAAEALTNAIQALMPKDAVPMTVYVVDENNQAALNYYAFHQNPIVEKAAWPGEGLTLLGQARHGKNVYRVELDTSRYDYVIFNNGAGWQTVDLAYTADAAALELPHIVYFLNSNEAVDGKYKAWPADDVWKIDHTTDATCTEAEKITLMSFVTGETRTEEGDPALGHDWSEWAVTTEPTCTEKGVETRTCSRCDETETRAVEALGHDLVHHEAKAPTCTEVGWDAYDTCSRCDYTTYKELPALGHDWSDWTVTTEPTCTEKGVETRTCARCNESETREVDALGHDLVHHEAKAPTCTEPGWEAYDTCSRCDYSTYVELPALGHEFGEWSHDEGSDPSTHSRVCSRCGEKQAEACSFEDHICTVCGFSDILPRTITVYVVDETKGENLYLYAWGTKTNAAYPGETLTAIGNDKGGSPYYSVTLSEADYTALLFNHGGDESKTADLDYLNDAGEHDYVVYYLYEQGGLQVSVGVDLWPEQSGVRVEPTCTEAGSVTYTGLLTEAKETVALPALGHDWSDWTVTTDPTCTEKGVETRTCARCNETETREVDALGHDLVHHEAKAPTCTEVGWDAYGTCSRCDYSTYKELPALGHDWSEWAVTTEPTCTEKGVETRTCARCNETETREVDALGHDLVHHEAKAPTCTEIGWDAYDTCSRCDYTTYVELPALGHDWSDWTVTTEATCTEKGVETRTCSRCNETETREVAALGHDLVHHEAKAPTCTEVGWDAYDTCSRCDYSTYVELPALGHDWSEWAVTTEPTCTEKGVETRTCSRCNETETREVAALGHDLVHHEAKAPTCTEIGWDAYDTCSRCDYSTYKELPALGHDWSEWAVTTEPTCTEKGVETRTCSRCDETETREVEALGHDLVHHEAKAPTCTEVGWDAYDTCSRCDYTTYKELPALGHDWSEWAVTTEPTCTEKGVETRTCARCNETETREVDALGHDLVHHEAKAPTCTEVGWDAYDTCSRCDYSTYVELPALGHDWSDWAVTTEPTCTDKGVETRTCSRCNETETREVDALGHDLVHHEAKAPTCTEIGWDAYDTCSHCDYTTYKELPALGHDWSEWTLTTEPTCTEKGVETRTCSRCNETETREVDALGHDLVHHEAKAPTCTEIGWDAYDTCSRCDYSTYKELPALGHDWSEWTLTTEPTCTEKGVETRTCSRCNETETREVDALGHDLVHHEAKAPTCTEVGWDAYDTCSRCDYSTYKELPALGHDWSDWTVTTEPTCTEKGVETRTCSRCEETETREVDALGHDLVHHEAKAPTCTEPGWEAYDTCSRCDYATTFTELPALGHDWGDWVCATTDTVCTRTRTCTRCGETQQEQIDLAALMQAIADAESVETERYTDESVAVLEAALAEAKAALEQAESQAAVDAAAKALNDAIEQLVEKHTFLFDDVQNPAAFYFEPVYWAYYADPQITNGIDATHFGPEQPCTRGHVVTFLWRAAGCPEPASAETPFTDLKAGAFYEKAVAWAVEEGITKGTSATKFSPNATCTRGQIVTFLWRFKGEAAPESLETPFTDLKPGAFYETAVAWAVEAGITKGTTATTFAPDDTCTRGQVVTFLYRVAAE